MPMKLSWAFRSCLGVLALVAARRVGRAADLPPIEIHGALSATAAYSDRYNYLGDTKDRLDLFSTEVTVNGTHQFSNGLRFGAQVYAYKLGDYRDLTLDFAYLDYSVTEWFGVRVGRNKQAIGLYGDTQDIDMIRPYALLPLDMYPKAMRTYRAAYDGIGFYGNIGAGRAGSVDYYVYGGVVPRYAANDPWLQIVNDAAVFRVTEVTASDRIVAGYLYWNTPLPGLRVGASAARTHGATFTGIVRSSAELAMAAADVRLVPFSLPPGVWDAMVAGRAVETKMRRVTQVVYSAEYTTGPCVFAAEYFAVMPNAAFSLPLLGDLGYAMRYDGGHIMGSWQALPRVQLGAYYDEIYVDAHDRHGRNFRTVPAHRAWTKDTAGTVCFSLASWWLLKAEAHFLNGTSILSGRENGDAAQWQPNWTYFVLKSTVSF